MSLLSGFIICNSAGYVLRDTRFARVLRVPAEMKRAERGRPFRTCYRAERRFSAGRQLLDTT